MAHLFYKCKGCGNKTDEYTNISDRDDSMVCKKCGGQREVDFDGGKEKSVMTSGENIRESRNLSMSIADVKSGRANEVHPGSNWGRPNRAGQCPMIVHDRREKLKRIKEKSKEVGIPLTEL